MDINALSSIWCLFWSSFGTLGSLSSIHCAKGKKVQQQVELRFLPGTRTTPRGNLDSSCFHPLAFLLHRHIFFIPSALNFVHRTRILKPTLENITYQPPPINPRRGIRGPRPIATNSTSTCLHTVAPYGPACHHGCTPQTSGSTSWTSTPSWIPHSLRPCPRTQRSKQPSPPPLCNNPLTTKFLEHNGHRPCKSKKCFMIFRPVTPGTKTRIRMSCVG